MAKRTPFTLLSDGQYDNTIGVFTYKLIMLINVQEMYQNLCLKYASSKSQKKKNMHPAKRGIIVNQAEHVLHHYFRSSCHLPPRSKWVTTDQYFLHQ